MESLKLLRLLFIILFLVSSLASCATAYVLSEGDGCSSGRYGNECRGRNNTCITLAEAIAIDLYIAGEVASLVQDHIEFEQDPKNPRGSGVEECQAGEVKVCSVVEGCVCMIQ